MSQEDLNKEKSHRMSKRSNKGQPPKHLDDYVLEDTTQNQSNLSSNESSDDDQSTNSRNRTVINETQNNNLLNIIERLSMQLNEFQKQRNNDIRARDDFNNLIMEKIDQLSTNQQVQSNSTQHAALFKNNSHTIENLHANSCDPTLNSTAMINNPRFAPTNSISNVTSPSNTFNSSVLMTSVPCLSASANSIFVSNANSSLYKNFTPSAASISLNPVEVQNLPSVYNELNFSLLPNSYSNVPFTYNTCQSRISTYTSQANEIPIMSSEEIASKSMPTNTIPTRVQAISTVNKHGYPAVLNDHIGTITQNELNISKNLPALNTTNMHLYPSQANLSAFSRSQHLQLKAASTESHANSSDILTYKNTLMDENVFLDPAMRGSNINHIPNSFFAHNSQGNCDFNSKQPSYVEQNCFKNRIEDPVRNLKSTDNKENPATNMGARSNMYDCPVYKDVHRKLHDLPDFTGLPEEWPMFIAAYYDSTRAFQYSNLENNLRLQKCVKGNARKAIQSLLIFPENIEQALTQLEFLYGRPEVLIRSQIDEVRQIGKIDENRLDMIIPFATKVQNMATFMEAANGFHHLANPTLMEELISKLPVNKQLDWVKYSIGIKPYPTIKDFSNWLDETARLICKIVPTTLLLNNPQDLVEKKSRSSKKTILHVAKATESTTFKSEKQVNTICYLCKENHRIFECKKFINVNVSDRWEIVKNKRLCFSCLRYGHTTFSCRFKKPCGKNGCRKHPHKTLHEMEQHGKSVTNSPNVLEEKSNISTNASAQSLLSCHTATTNELPGVIFKVVPVKLYGQEKVIDSYALLDDGSEVSIIDEDLVSELGIQEISEQPLNLKWYGDIKSSQNSKIFNLKICGVSNGCKQIELKNVRSVKNLQLPIQSLCLKKLNSRHVYLKDLPIVDYAHAHPKILIGIDNCHVGLSKEIKCGKPDEPVCIKTKLGTIVYGPTGNKTSSTIQNSLLIVESGMYNLHELNDIVKEYFSTENFGVNSNQMKLESTSNMRARQIMESTTVSKGERYETGLLWSKDDVTFPDSLKMATQRLYGVEKKMRNNPIFAAEYKRIMEYYVSCGYARKLTKAEFENHGPRTWYLPHFGVQNPSKPEKLRIVFDAAASVNGVSLNSMLLTGPDQYRPLPTILHQFRQGKVVICGDIKEMFHQVHIRPDDQDSQRFLWRSNSSDPIEKYAMVAMTFGATCSPSSAQYVKNKNANQFQDEYPEAVKAIINNHYVDDYVKSFNDEDAAIDITKSVTRIHKNGGFILRNFISNSKIVIEALKESDECQNLVSLNKSDDVSVDKILGMLWETSSDMLTFKFNFYRIDKELLELRRNPTKREFLSIVMSVFDPFGLLASFTIYAKIMMQEVWKIGVEWDSPLPENISKKWKLWQSELQNAEMFRIPRCYSPYLLSAVKIQLHIFVDASESAFAASSYFRIDKGNNDVEVAFIAGKTKCAPQNLLSVPRLELQAAVLGTRLLVSIQEIHEEIKIDKICLWSDSNTVIHWIKSDHRQYKPFVAHRVAEILENTSVSNWNWLPTKLNPADDATRDKNSPKITTDSHWIKGPEFLRNNEDSWPCQEKILKIVNEEEIRPKFRQIFMINEQKCILSIERFSKYIRLIRVTAWMMRYIFNSKAAIGKNEKQKGELTVKEICDAENYLYREIQRECFTDEYRNLKSGKLLDKSSSIYQLTPYLDENEVLRVYGRIDNASAVSYSVRRPIILPKSHHLTRLIVAHHHELMRHSNQEAIICSIRQKFWITNIRVIVKVIRKECQVCKIKFAKAIPPLMGQIPEDRLTPFVRPFTYTGLDYFGPVYVAIGRRREKRWIALFTCLTIRAIHIELAEDLSTDACLLCIRNFINRRGVPVRIRSDNGTNFVGAQREIMSMDDFLDNSRIKSELSTKHIEWEFNCPSNPHAGGCWERMVQSVKTVLQFSLKELVPRVETLRSYLIEAENIVNSRPLTHVPIAFEDDEPLTPNHFLLGTINSTQTPRPESEKFIYRKQWRIAQQLKDCFWKRWLLEFLPVLTRRSKWCERVVPIKVDDLVIICDSDMPRNQWVRGRVMKTYPGKDGQVRMADVKTATSIMRRPASKIAVLDVSSKSSEAIYRGRDVEN